MVWEAGFRNPPTDGTILGLDADDDVVRPQDWGAVDVGHVTILWYPSTHDENFAGLDERLQKISDKYQSQMDAAEKLHDKEVGDADSKREAATNKIEKKGIADPTKYSKEYEKIDKEHEVAVLIADDKLTAALWSIGRKIEHDLAQSLGVVFERKREPADFDRQLDLVPRASSPPARFVLYRRDTDSWIEVSNLQEAIEATTEAIDEYREFGESTIERIAVTQQFGRRGSIVARFDPSQRGYVPVSRYTRRTNG